MHHGNTTDDDDLLVEVRRVRDAGGTLTAIGGGRQVPFRSLRWNAAGLLATPQGEALVGHLPGGGHGAILAPAQHPATPTRRVHYRANLPRLPAIPASGGVDAAGFSRDPSTAGVGGVIADDAARFLGHSLTGGTVAVRSAIGTTLPLTLRWIRFARAKGRPERWNLYHLSWALARGSELTWRNLGFDLHFAPGGQLADGCAAEITTELLVEGRRIGPVTITLDGITQFDDWSGLVAVKRAEADGAIGGELQEVRIGLDGAIVARYGTRDIVLGHATADSGTAHAA